MKRHLAVILGTLLAGTAWAQGTPPGAPAAARNAPPTAKPTLPRGNTPSNAPGAGGGNAPANTPAATTASGTKTLTVRVPSGSPYTAYIQEAPSSLKSISDKGELEVPTGVKQYTVYVLDSQSGYASRKTVDAAAPPAELSFSSPDFKLVQKVRVQVTGKGDKPIAQGIVSLTDGSKAVSRKVIQPSSQGMVDFDFVVSGGGSITVSPQGGSATTKEVTLDLRKGETMQTIPVALPEVAATVEPPPGSSPPAPTGNAPGSAPANAPAAPAAPQAPVQPAPAPAAQPLPPPASGGGWGGQFIAWVFLLALLGGGYLYMRSRGITADMLLKKLGVQPDVAAGVGGAGPVGPGAPAAPPPLVADPNQCPFCGQMKDPGGNCACTVLPGGASPAGGFGARAYGDGGGAASGPRLVGVQGTYMGHVFPVSGAMVLGREATNPIPLDQDTTTSRRHAQIVADGGGYRIQDLGSSNGTYVNGARVTEAALASGDEISVGGTRFRFEV